MARSRQSASEWARRVSAWRRSGETAAEYAGRRGWNPHTLRWWASELRARAAGELAPASPAFVEVVVSGNRSGGPLEVVLAGGCTVRVSSTTDLDLLRAVVDTLGARP